MELQKDSSQEVRQMQRDRMMQERAKEWLMGCSLWHFARVTDQVDASLRPEACDVWIALADAKPAQTAGILLTERPERWEILAYKTVPKVKHSPEVIEDRLQLLIAALRLQQEPVWRSDRAE